MKDYQIKPYWNICRRVYLVWAMIIALGFVSTQFHQLPDINNLWLLLSFIGLGYMAIALLQLKLPNLQLIYIGLIWLLTIGFGLFMSIAAFMYEPLGELTAYLGSFWLLLMGVGLGLNSLVDRSPTYLIFGGIEILFGIACYLFDPLILWQYLIAGGVGAIAMLGLIIYR